MKISCVDFVKEKWRYELDLETGEVAHREMSDVREAQSGTRGHAAVVRVGLKSPARQLFAFYAMDQRIFLYANQLFEVSSETVEVKRSTLFPFIKKFSIVKDGREVAAWNYWFTDFLEDGFNPRDFLAYIADKIASNANLKTFIPFWEEMASGRDPARDSFQEELRKITQTS